MKTFIRCISSLLFVGLTLVLFAQNDPIIGFREEGKKSFLVNLQNLQNETYHLALIDSKGYTFFTEKLDNQNTFKKRYNLKNLPKGQYYFIFESDRKLIKQPILASNHLIGIREQNQELKLKPTLAFNYPYVDLNMLHFEQAKVTVSLKDLNGEIIYIAGLRDFGGISKRFDITDLPKGTYVIQIHTQDYHCQKEFSIDKDFGDTLSNDPLLLTTRD